jgi:phosphomannomutase
MTPNPRTLADLAAQSAVRFGTSGVRGLVTDLSPDICRAYTQAFLELAGRREGSILIGYDLRPSSPMIAAACATEIERHGLKAVNAGILPTPALAFASQSWGLPAIMITGSHIPFDRNGMKFYLPHGEISKADEQQMLATSITPITGNLSALPPPIPDALLLYRKRYQRAFKTEALAGFTVGVYEHSSAARDVIHAILQDLGARTMSLGRSDNFVPVDTEAVSEDDRERGRTWAREHALDAIVTTDGDADRPLIADEAGVWLRGDIVGILCARGLGAATVVTPVSSTTALEACGQFGTLIRTRIGSPHVIAAMEAARNHPVVGYEANGGFLLGSDVQLGGNPLAALKTRDALLPIILVLAEARRMNAKLSALVAQLPPRYTHSDRLQNVNVEACRTLLALIEREPSCFESLTGVGLGTPASLDTTDGVRATFQGGDILHLRLSGNAPELRCYAESGSPERALQLCQSCLADVRALI